MSLDIHVSPGKILDVLSYDEARLVIQQWIDIFASKRKRCRIKDFKWHIFSGGYYESEEGKSALTSYSKHISERYLVIDNAEDCVFFTDLRPDKIGLSDYFVCPPNFAWTMAFTHEDGWLGPYFAKHPNYRMLEAENNRSREKLKQIEEAKRKGWC